MHSLHLRRLGILHSRLITKHFLKILPYHYKIFKKNKSTRRKGKHLVSDSRAYVTQSIRNPFIGKLLKFLQWKLENILNNFLPFNEIFDFFLRLVSCLPRHNRIWDDIPMVDRNVVIAVVLVFMQPIIYIFDTTFCFQYERKVFISTEIVF